MKIVITGASGFIGKHLVDFFLEKEADCFLYTISRHPVDLRASNKRVVHICDDLTDENALCEKLLAAGVTRPDVFYHLAWSGVTTREKNNFEIQQRNLDYGMCALSVCNKIGAKLFVNLGTSAEYVACNGLINSRSRPMPNDIYGAMKIASHYLLEMNANLLHQAYIHTILASTFGEGRLDDNVISYTIKTLLCGDVPDYGSLEQMWDFLYIKDAVYALYLIGKFGKPGETYAIGSGQYRHLSEFIETIRDMIDPSLKLNIGIKKQQYAAIQNSCMDLFNLQRDTPFVPQYTFADGIRRTIDYFNKKGD